MKKDLHVSHDTQLHMSTTYKRNQSGAKEKQGAKRTFSYVISGMLIAATLVGSVVLPSGVAEASAAPVKQSVEFTQMKQQSPAETAARGEATQVTNLRMANKVLAAALKSGQLDGYVYDNVSKRLATISDKIDQGAFSDSTTLEPVLQETGALLRTMVNEEVGTAVLTQRSESLQALDQLLAKLSDGTQIGDADTGVYTPGNLGVARAGREKEFTVQLGAHAKNETWGASTGVAAVSASKSPTVTINGTQMHFNQNPVIRNNSVMIPMRDIFEVFGAKVSWNSATQTVTAVKDGVTMQLKMGSTKATIDGRAVTLTAAVTSVEGVTMVPLRFVSEALNADVSWNAAQNRVEIKADGVGVMPVFGGGKPMPSPSAPSTGNTGIDQGQTVKGVRAQYGSHTYASDNQAQYDQVMALAKAELAKTKPMPKFFDEYMAGERFDGNLSNGSIKNRSLKNLESRIGALVQAGVPRSTIERLFQGTMSAGTYTETAKDYGDAAGQYSAYHTMVKKTTDCDAIAQTYLVMLDQLGFSTAVYRQPGHAEAVVNLPGYGYFVVTGSNFNPTGGPSNMTPGNTIMVAFN